MNYLDEQRELEDERAEENFPPSTIPEIAVDQAVRSALEVGREAHRCQRGWLPTFIDCYYVRCPFCPEGRHPEDDGDDVYGFEAAPVAAPAPVVEASDPDDIPF